MRPTHQDTASKTHFYISLHGTPHEQKDDLKLGIITAAAALLLFATLIAGTLYMHKKTRAKAIPAKVMSQELEVKKVATTTQRL